MIKTAKRNSRQSPDGLSCDESGAVFVSSCSETRDVAETFMGNADQRTLFKIECTNSKAIKAHSYIKLEDEILLMPGTYLLYTKGEICKKYT